MVISAFKDDAPWLFVLGLDVYHSLQRGDERLVVAAVENFETALSAIRRGPMKEFAIDSAEVDMAVHELGRLAHLLLIRKAEPRRIGRRVGGQEGKSVLPDS